MYLCWPDCPPWRSLLPSVGDREVLKPEDEDDPPEFLPGGIGGNESISRFRGDRGKTLSLPSPLRECEECCVGEGDLDILLSGLKAFGVGFFLLL